ncbi:protein VASCULAR ASSOCIATED DEATH 1, chloroplastic isoform X1 [Medicago truncatula]|uniref:PH-GRAM1-TCB1D9-TCB1D9B domain protein n=1 Tax=Medicago truncatula TaxID=3880 RepID=A0A072TJX9_MEDTR|nr:protein VASCULAR ASSOCIATED DEATH 1, chloroplastic isoform X1 [Medicago truncatula]KEH17844.1 PH-GRAM1-TCB1D9-TCB1D9B domain protein [Medicago truncatula]
MASTAVATAESPQHPVQPSPSSSVVDRNHSSNSSPNFFNSSDIPSPDALKSEEYRQLFRLPQEEVLIEDFNCALQENILIQGHMYLFVNYICFYSNIFGFETKRIIPLHEITGVRRAKTAGIFPNAIEIISGSKKYFFASFLSRDEAFKIINDGWLRQGNDARAIMEQQESISESSSQENGFLTIENVKSSDVLDNEALSTDLSKGNSICKDLGVPSITGEDPILMVVPEEQSSAEQVAESELNNNDPPRLGCNWNEEDIDAPTTPEAYTCVAESIFPIKVEDFFWYFFSDDAINFLESYRKRCGDKDFKCASWHPQEKFGYARELSFQHPIKIYLGAKSGGCHEVQKYRVYRNSHLVIQTSQEVSDVPYADYFLVEGLWNVERDKDESKERCILRVYVNVAFSKKTIFRGKIVQSTIDECKDAYALWINMAHEFLQEKNLVKQESGSIAAVVKNGKMNFDREAKTGETSEGSQDQSNPTGRQTTSDAINAIHSVSAQLQDNFIDTSSSVPSLFKEFATKIRSSLKSQSNLSLLLVTIFALIFFMQQFSILVLLARPQHIHMNPPVDFMNRMDNGVTRSPSDIAWLEKRVHHLKDEMYMVETRLERMRYEHVLLKKQLKDLEHK